MTYNFDEIVDRKNTNSAKWDSGENLIAMGIAQRFDKDTLPLFTADMDFRCPPSVKAEIQKVVDFNLYGYTTLHPSFSGEYFSAVTGWFKRHFNWDISPEEVIYMDGTISAVKHALLAFSKEGDGVLINRPIYTPFTKTILSTNRRVVNSALINNDGYYTIDFEDFEKKAALPDTTCFILCNPHNPTGRIWSDADLVKMYNICKKNNVVVIADEIHGDLIRNDSAFHPLATLVGKENLVSCTAANKTFNLAGLKATNVIIQDSTLRSKYMAEVGLLMLSPITAAAVIGAYNGGEEWLSQLKTYLDGTIDWVMDFCKTNLPKMKCSRPEGTYIFWMDFNGYGLSPQEISRKIYFDANVVLEGGLMFDPENGGGFERICLSTRREIVKEAFYRIAKQF
ncbi:MAG: aminotransferase class I/II-fold pyridoxal phosphate-dependent enzyme, partial [Oscillospiraceae bacterium]